MSNSKIYLGSTNLGTGKIRLGANDVSAIYLGSSLLYPPSAPADVNYVTITNTSNRRGDFSIYSSDRNFPNYTNLEYSYDTVTWMPLNTVYDDNINIYSGDSIYLRGTGNGADFDNEEFTKLNFSQYHTVSGDLATLIDYRTASTLTVPQYAYYNLFKDDTKLTSADLFYTDFDKGGSDTYKRLFNGCTNLSEVSITTSNWSTVKTQDWLTNVAASGTIIVKGDETNLPTDSTSGVPTGWNCINLVNNNILSFTATTAPASFTLDNRANTINPVIYYSTDNGINWTQWDYSTITLQNVGDKVYFYGDNPNGFSVGNGAYAQFSTNGNRTGRIAASGDIMSLIHYSCPTTVPNSGCFYKLFKQFSELTTAPSIGATTLTQSCFAQMFSGCSNLTTAPQLNATTVPAYAYQQMFEACSGLLQAPALPATTIGNYAYSMMFWQCTQITTAPDLMTQTLPEGAYNNMFNGCSNLNSVRCMATDISASLCTNNWLLNVAQTGEFYKSTVTNWPTGGSGIPTGWTPKNAYTCEDDWTVLGHNSAAECTCARASEYMGHATIGDCMCNEFNECPDCTNDYSTLGFSTEEECNCYYYDTDCPVDCSDCSNWEYCGYESYEDCNCQQYGDCLDCSDCNNWSECGYESYEDCQCQQYGECGEPVDCTDWENLGYESEEDCDCAENGNCPEEEEPEEEEPEP